MSQMNDDLTLFAQESFLSLEFEKLLKTWIVQRQEGKKPSSVTKEEMSYIALLSVTCLRQKGLGEQAQDSWAPFLPALENWVVQRKRGEAPTRLSAQDFEIFVRLVLQALSRPFYLEKKEEAEILEEKKRAQDPLAFLREHLAQGL